MKIQALGYSILLMIGSALAFADTDSSAIDERALTAAVQQSSGVMMKVPVDAQGQELPGAAELRVVNAESSSTDAANLPALWNTGVDASSAPQQDTNVTTGDGDSSTNRFWGWNRWRGGWGWTPNVYYNWYRPVYVNRGVYYNYGRPYYYNNYYPYNYRGYNYWGYRYYYYPRY